MLAWIVASMFAAILIALSIRANARFAQERTLPMQWSLSRSKPLPQLVTWSAPRVVALSFTPCLAIVVLALFMIAVTTLTARSGEEWMVLPTLILVGAVFVAAHAFHLWMIAKTLRHKGS